MTPIPARDRRAADPDRTVWDRAARLAFLLVGELDPAVSVARHAAGRTRRFSALPRRRRDRLVILEARRVGRPEAPRRRLNDRLRDWRRRVRAGHRSARGLADRPAPPPTADGAGPPLSPPAMEVLAALRGLPAQQREAWVLREVEGLGDIDAAVAMDCSRAALARHLELASASLRAILGAGLDSARDALRSEAERLPVPDRPPTGLVPRFRPRTVIGVIVAVALTVAAAIALLRVIGP